MRVDTLLVAQPPPFVILVSPLGRADSVQRVDFPPEQATRLQPAPPTLQEALPEPMVFVLPAAFLLGERPVQIA
jgi:hypothetical protein